MDNEIYNSLRSRKLLDILDGDTGFGIIKIATSIICNFTIYKFKFQINIF